MEWFRLFRQFVVLAFVVLLLLIVVPTASGFPPKASPTATPARPYKAPTVVPVIPYNSLVEVVSLDGWTDVRDKPCGPTVRFQVRTGTKARVAEYVWACGDVWYRVEFANGKQDWLPSYMVHYLGR